MQKKFRWLVLALSVTLALWLMAPPALAQEGSVSLPVLFSGNLTGVIIEKGGKVSLDLKVTNKGKTAQPVDLRVASAPPGWTVGFRSRFPAYELSQVYLPADDFVTLEFYAEPPQDVPESTYKFTLEARPADGSVLPLPITVGVRQKAGAVTGVKLAAREPTLSGPSDRSFEFRLDLTNGTPEDRSFDLTATVPQGWSVNFKPEFESKTISTISLKKDETKGIIAEVTSPYRVAPDKYPAKVGVRSGNQSAEQELEVAVTGTYTLSLGTSTGLLNTKAIAGRPSPFTMSVQNQGTDMLKSINLSPSKPAEWQVNFDPDRIEQLQAGESRDVNVEIIPVEKAIPGDYMITIFASSDKASKQMDIRTTVSTPTTWGLVGVIIVVVVIGAVVGLFVRLGRR